MESSMKGNLSIIREMEKEFIFTPMVIIMKGNGCKTKELEKEKYHSVTIASSLGNSLMIKQMGMASIMIEMEIAFSHVWLKRKKETRNQAPFVMENYLSKNQFLIIAKNRIGKVKYRNQDKFKGQFKDGRPSGYGNLKYVQSLINTAGEFELAEYLG